MKPTKAIDLLEVVRELLEALPPDARLYRVEITSAYDIPTVQVHASKHPAHLTDYEVEHVSPCKQNRATQHRRYYVHKTGNLRAYYTRLVDVEAIVKEVEK